MASVCKAVRTMIRALIIAIVLLTTSVTAEAQYTSTYRGRTYRVNSVGRIPNCRLRYCPMCDELQRNFQMAMRTNTPQEAVVVAAERAAETWQPMPKSAVAAMLKLVRPSESDVVYDLGCGDGRILEYAHLKYGCPIVGVEINLETYERCLARLGQAKCHGTIIHGDATECDLSQADVVTLYLFSDVMERLQWGTLKMGATVISYGHPIPGKECQQIKDFFIYHHGRI